MQKTSIEWTDRSCNPIRARHRITGKVGWHCVKHSPGCAHCYSERMNLRLGTGLPFAARSADEIELFLDTRPLEAVRRLRKPSKIFVCDMTDLFMDSVPDEWIDAVFAYAAWSKLQTFQVLTKRADRMRAWASDPDRVWKVFEAVRKHIDDEFREGSRFDDGDTPFPWPLPNVWLGVSCEDQARADERIPHLLRTPAAVRFLSVEPLLGPVRLTSNGYIEATGDHPEMYGFMAGPDDGKSVLSKTRDEALASSGIDWVIVGGESGPNARPMHPMWACSVRDQCQAAGVPFLFKQWGEFAPLGPISDLYLGNSDPRWRNRVSVPSGVPMDEPTSMFKVGKKVSGRVLDGRTWDEFPTPANERSPA